LIVNSPKNQIFIVLIGGSISVASKVPGQQQSFFMKKNFQLKACRDVNKNDAYGSYEQISILIC